MSEWDGQNWRPARERRADVPGVVERVEYSTMRPGELRRVKALLFRRIGMDFTEERKGAVEVGVPGDGSDGGDSRGGERCAGGHEALLHEKRRSCARRDSLRKWIMHLKCRTGCRTRGGIADTLLWGRGELEDAPATSGRAHTEPARPALAAMVARAPTTLETFFRAPAGSLESIVQ